MRTIALLSLGIFVEMEQAMGCPFHDDFLDVDPAETSANSVKSLLTIG